MNKSVWQYLRRYLIISVAIILALVLVECVSSIVLYLINPNAGAKPKFNRELSGYTVFRNTPNFTLSTIKESPEDKDLKTDAFGFLCDEEIKMQKDSGVVRIFLMGGSAAIGGGQTQVGDCYNSVKEFPTGIYAYNISIAGYLKKYLTEKFSGKKIQVVNGACYDRQLHQSMLAYLELVNRFHPDIVVNLDGFNDLGTLCTGSVYELPEQSFLKRYADLKSNNESVKFRFKTFQLIYYLLMKVVDPGSRKSSSQKAMIAKKDMLLAAAGTGGLKSDCACVLDAAVYNHEKYEAIRSYLVKSSTPWLNTVDRYMNMLRDDSVKFLFALQPMLGRTTNKSLAPYEQVMQRDVDVFHKMNGTGKGNSIPFNTNGDPRIDFSEVNGLGSSEGIKYLLTRYFFDDYLSDKLKSDIEARGFVYTDMNKEIQQLGTDFEFYSDYCHMTKAGQKFTGEKIGELIVKNGWIK